MKKPENTEKTEKNLENSERRKFMEKFGVMTGAVPVGMLVLMSPTKSKASSSSGGSDSGGGF